jgi:hypothetical protein
MGKKKLQPTYTTTKKRKLRKTATKGKKRQEKVESEKIEKGVTEICSSFQNILEFTGQPAVVDDKTTNFLNDCGLANAECKRSKHKRTKRTKKNRNKTYSMLKLLESLPEVDPTNNTQETSSSILHNLPVKIVKPDFAFNQRDSKKFYKRILKKERSKSRKAKRAQEYD